MLDTSPDTTPRWELYRVLSEPVRLRLLALAAEEELAIGELAEILEESQPNVSRHAGSLRQAGLLSVRKEGTRALVRLRKSVDADPVVADALLSGRRLCEAEGILSRIADVLRTRDSLSREFFAQASREDVSAYPSELGSYIAALGPLLASTRLAVDAGTGDGGFLEVLAPVFSTVLAIDRADVRLARARERVALRAFGNVRFVGADIDSEEVRSAVGPGADAVFASRLLHHAPTPLGFLRDLVQLCRPGGALVLLDYLRHDDESMRQHADLWLGFERDELAQFAEQVGLEQVRVVPVGPGLRGRGPDSHLDWQILTGRRPFEGGPPETRIDDDSSYTEGRSLRRKGTSK